MERDIIFYTEDYLKMYLKSLKDKYSITTFEDEITDLDGRVYVEGKRNKPYSVLDLKKLLAS